MSPGGGVLVAVSLAWVALVGSAAGRPVPARVEASRQAPAAVLTAPSAPPPAQPGEYLGSGACRRCHEATFEAWANSLHVQMTRPVAEARVIGDFSGGQRVDAGERSYRFGRRDGRPMVTIASANAAAETFAVDYTLGAKRYQGYLSTLPDGRIYVLPVFWHRESGRWVDWKEITPIPDRAHDLRQIWNTNCFNCHATNIVQGYDPATRRYQSSWTEMGIGCEACHGPGRDHVALAESWERDPSLKPAYDSGPDASGLTDLLAVLSPRPSDPRRTFDACAYCHGNKVNVFTGFRAGERYEDYALPFLMSEPIPAHDPQGEYWPDGRPNRFNRPQALTLSGCFQAGAVTCTSCHVAHGSPYAHSLKVDVARGRYGDVLCTQCHADVPLAEHTFHDADGEGSRCINCHMSDVNWRLLIRRRDHTFQAPVPELTAKYGAPNACTTCHDDRTPEWAAARMDAWWGDGARRRKAVDVADVMYRAGSGDGSVLPDLGRLAVDRTLGAVLRASAADYVTVLVTGRGSAGAQSQTSYVTTAREVESARATAAPVLTVPPRVVNALMGAASDPEPMVRAAAVRALGATGSADRVVPALTARLVDQARVVRARAAEALLALGIVELPGIAGVALDRAQDEYAESLRAFADSAPNHAARGWLEAERGRADEAHRAVDEAIQVDPTLARPYVIKGVLAARGGRVDEALGWFRKARALDPAFPRLGEMMAEAEKRKAGAR